MAWPMNYTEYPRPVAQIDPTACWAASLEWWLTCMNPKRSPARQIDLISRYVRYWDARMEINGKENKDYGTVSAVNFVKMISQPEISMEYLLCTVPDLQVIRQKLSQSPVIIAYYEPKVKGSHVNVIHSTNLDHSLGDINVMEPNQGRFESKDVRRFTTKQCLLGWAKQ